MYSFFPHLRVSRMYAGREELLGYMHRLADAYGLRAHLRLNHEITEARWMARAACGASRRAEGNATRVLRAGVGQLNQPSIPPSRPGNLSGRELPFRALEWRRRTARQARGLVGNAASAVQYVPEIAPEVAHLTVFQRSANWIMPRNQQVFTQEQLDAYEADPAAFEASRRYLHAFRENGFRRTQMGTDEQRQGVDVAKAHLAAQVADPQLRAKLTPDYELAASASCAPDSPR